MYNGSPAPTTCIDRFLARVEVSAASRYTQASIVYLLYVSIILFINLSLSPAADAAYNDDVYYYYELVTTYVTAFSCPPW